MTYTTQEIEIQREAETQSNVNEKRLLEYIEEVAAEKRKNESLTEVSGLCVRQLPIIDLRILQTIEEQRKIIFKLKAVSSYLTFYNEYPL